MGLAPYRRARRSKLTFRRADERNGHTFCSLTNTAFGRSAALSLLSLVHLQKLCPLASLSPCIAFRSIQQRRFHAQSISYSEHLSSLLF